MIEDADLSGLLKRHFGYGSFRPLQREIIEAALHGRDVVAILPTGAGKSLCFQLPALAREGVTLVVSPLIALMKDQVDQLTASGIAATYLNSTLDPAEYRERLEGVRAGAHRLVYLAPERLLAGAFLDEMRRWKVSAIAIDEAHCISEWGHDFRPEYRRLRELREALPGVPVMALTATATRRVRADIGKQLGLEKPAEFLASFNRPNLNYLVEPKRDATGRVIDFIRGRPDESGIVYCQSRKRTEELASALVQAGIAARPYHAGMEGADRSANQEAFLRDEARVICATVAFGMGIDKPDVRFVIHADLPKNVEGYYQETGRAGRDGLPADCLLLFTRSDVMKHQRFIDEMSDDRARRQAQVQLEQMAAYAERDLCRRVELLGYFGEEWTEDNCGACDHCLTPREEWDATLEAQKLISCVLRIAKGGGPPVGLRHVADVLVGSVAKKILRRGHERLSTHGVGREHPSAHWVEIGRQLVRRGWLALDGEAFPTVSVTAEGRRLLKERAAVSLTRPVAAARASLRRPGEIECDEGLCQRLRERRKAVADAAGVAPYVVFSEVTLRHMAREYPTDEAAFRRLPGVGERKLADHGAAFMKEVADWLAEHPRRQFAALKAPAPPPSVNATALATLGYFREGKSLEEIAKLRGLAASTIETHLARVLEAGETLGEAELRRLFSKEEEQRMRVAFEGWDEVALRPVFDKLDGEIGYAKLKIFRALETRRADRGRDGALACAAPPFEPDVRICLRPCPLRSHSRIRLSSQRFAPLRRPADSDIRASSRQKSPRSVK